MTSGARADELGVVAAPWLAAGLAAPALAVSGAIGVAVVALAPFLLTLRTGRLAPLTTLAAVTCALLGAGWSAHGIAARAADPLRARIGHLELARLVVDGQPRPGRFGSSAIARLDGHCAHMGCCSRVPSSR